MYKESAIFWDKLSSWHIYCYTFKYVSSENLLKSSLIAPCIILARKMKTTWRSLFIIEIWLRSECGSWDSSLKWNLKPYLFTRLSLLKKLCTTFLKCVVLKTLYAKTKHLRRLVQSFVWRLNPRLSKGQ